jgi:hypothetical protein
MLFIMAVKHDLTATEIVIKYLRYLKKKHHMQRIPLDENTTDGFDCLKSSSAKLLREPATDEGTEHN